jgi:hypothetical protein
MTASMITQMLGVINRAANRNNSGAMTVRKITICLPDIFMYIAPRIAALSI